MIHNATTKLSASIGRSTLTLRDRHHYKMHPSSVRQAVGATLQSTRLGIVCASGQSRRHCIVPLFRQEENLLTK